MAIRKALPPQTVPNLIPPKDDYVYFESPLENPFRARADQFDDVNAGWLIDASLLVYGDRDFIKARVNRLAALMPGADVRVFRGPSTQALVLSAGDFVIVAFRGTRFQTRADPIAVVERARGEADAGAPPSGLWVTFSWPDVMSDINVKVGSDGIHCGFLQALDQATVWNDIQAYLTTLAGRSVWFTGHSLGAALATIAAARFAAGGSVQGLYTFGSPRVGTAIFTRTVPGATWRIVNNQDVIARVPPTFLGYEHVGTLKSIDAKGDIGDAAAERDPLPERLKRAWTAWRGPIGELIRQGKSEPAELIQQLRQLDIEIPENGLNDHAPINYACHVWNNA
jgi:hypothetical protein